MVLPWARKVPSVKSFAPLLRFLRGADMIAELPTFTSALVQLLVDYRGWLVTDGASPRQRSSDTRSSRAGSYRSMSPTAASKILRGKAFRDAVRSRRLATADGRYQLSAGACPDRVVVERARRSSNARCKCTAKLCSGSSIQAWTAC